ncbi:hypothetical protein NPIL_225491 [Nephila pilipes]|uniref:Uncharacterized protein n=1 Tax=Nephila pilipes TaxID=299642 RepID=A0A8X6QLN6_NEPPI|nr:hypothetical protein NPIL_225491 [Nephila pilipes]
MFIGIVQVFFGMVLLATGVFSNSEEDDNFVAIRTCIATSKNQTLCDEFVACGVHLPKRVADDDQNCIRKIHPAGYGRCNDHEELYGNKADRDAIHDCAYNALSSELTDEESTAVALFMVCINDLGKKCFGESS